MRSIFLFCVLALLTVPMIAAAKQNDMIDLAKTPWGMSRSETAAALGVSPPKGEDPFVMKAKLYGQPVGIMYVFWQGQLSAVNVQMVEGLDEGRAKTMMAQLENDLIARYGKAQKENAPCHDNKLCAYSKWEKDRETDVVLQHERQHSLERITLIYVSREAVAAKRRLEHVKIKKK
jgi:hypothetical protein